MPQQAGHAAAGRPAYKQMLQNANEWEKLNHFDVLEESQTFTEDDFDKLPGLILGPIPAEFQTWLDQHNS